MLTAKSANAAKYSNFLSSTFRLFFETWSGSMLSILIWRCSSPASFNDTIFFGVRRYPLVIMPAIIPWYRILLMMLSISGWTNGSPPLIVTMAVFKDASLSMRRIISSVGTGGEKSSYSLQYLQARLHRRVGMM